jgi:hypothetical protein
MSKYNYVGVKLADRECLVKALMAVGYKTEQIEVHDEPVNLYGYNGDVRAEKAHVIIRRHNVGESSNDVGFVIGSDGRAIVSDFDLSTNFSRARVDQVMREYSHALICKLHKGKTVETETLPDGSQVLRVRVIA